MYVNAAYLNDHLPAVVDMSRSIIVTSCGNYRIKTRNSVETKRPFGRKDYQLIYIASGKAHFNINGRERVLSAGNVVIYKPDEPQDYAYYKEDRTDVYWVHFTGCDVEMILDHYRINAKDNIISIGTSPDYRFLFGQMIIELRLCRPRYEELLSLLLRNILILLSRSIESGNTFNDMTEKEIMSAAHYFRKNYSTEINIDEYAASKNFSAGWFIRCFRQMIGQTPLQYILSLRIANAQSLLENTDCTVSEITENVGYDNALYFSRLFKKHTGISPSEYRKANQEK